MRYEEPNIIMYYNDATRYGLEFLQAYNFELITNINTELANHIRAEIFLGITAGEDMPSVAKRILEATDNSLTGKTLSARQRAMMIARTECYDSGSFTVLC